MCDLAAQPAHYGLQALDLVADRACYFRGRHGDFEAPEVGAVGVARVGPDMYAPLQRQPRGPLHGGFVSGVSAAGDVGRRDVLHQVGFMLGVFEFANVAVEIDHKEKKTGARGRGPGKVARYARVVSELGHRARGVYRSAARRAALPRPPAPYKAYNHFSCSCSHVSACSMVTISKCTSSRGRNCPRRQKSAEITLAGLGYPPVV